MNTKANNRFKFSRAAALIVALSCVVASCLTLGIASIIVLENFRNQYQQSVDTLFFKRNSLLQITNELVELRRHENLITAKNDALVDMQFQRMQGIQIRVGQLLTFEDDSVDPTLVKSIGTLLNRYFLGYEKVAEWVRLVGDFDSGLMGLNQKIGSALFESTFDQRLSAPMRERLQMIENKRLKFLYYDDRRAFADLIEIVDSTIILSDSQKLEESLRNFRENLGRLYDLRRYIEIERASFVTLILETKSNIDVAISLLDQRIKTTGAGLKNRVYLYSWLVLALVLLILVSSVTLAQNFRKTTRDNTNQNKSLKTRSDQFQQLLTHINVGIVNFDHKGLVLENYSNKVMSLTNENNLQFKNIFYLFLECSDLHQEQIKRVKTVLSLIFDEEEYCFEANEHLLPTSFKYIRESGDILDLKVDWFPNLKNDRIESFSLFLTDKSYTTLLEQQVDQVQIEATILSEVLYRSTIEIYEFFSRNRSLVESCQRLAKNIWQNNCDEDWQQLSINLKLMYDRATDIEFIYLANSINTTLRYISQSVSGYKDKSVEITGKMQNLLKVFLLYRQTYNEKVVQRSSKNEAFSEDPLLEIMGEIRVIMRSTDTSLGLQRVYHYIKKRKGHTVKAVVYECFSKNTARSNSIKIQKRLEENIPDIMLSAKGYQQLSDLIHSYFRGVFALAHFEKLEHEAKSLGVSENDPKVVSVKVEDVGDFYEFCLIDRSHWRFLKSYPISRRSPTTSLSTLVKYFRKDLLREVGRTAEIDRVRDEMFKNLSVFEQHLFSLQAHSEIEIDWSYYTGKIIIRFNKKDQIFENFTHESEGNHERAV